jgi:phage/plasmid-like protein (TIGR03299 family)
MAHEITELAPGVHAFVSAREDAWHKLGVTLESTFDAETALREANLADWDVRKVPLEATDFDGGKLDIPNRWATVFTNPVTGQTQYLGVVGSTYTPIQNEANAELLDAIVDEGGAHFETAGSLREGRETFVSMKIPKTIMVGGEDLIDNYLVAVNSHDGSSSFRFMVTPIRVVCANTLTWASQHAKSSFTVRHVSGASGKIQEAREALGLTFKYLDVFEGYANLMLDTRITDDKFHFVMDKLFYPKNGDESKRQWNAYLQNMDAVEELWHNSPTIPGEMRATAWGAWQALTEYVDHFMPVRDTQGNEAISRAYRTVSSPQLASMKNSAVNLLMIP